MADSLLIFIGAGFGGVFRYWISNGVYFLMGLLFVLTLERFDSTGLQLRALLLIGLLGGYTTFSSFSIETINLFESGNWLSAMMNIFLSTIVCIMATWIGVIGGRKL